MKKLFKLWDEHTAGFCRVLFIAMIGAVFSKSYADTLCVFILILWLIVKTGYEQGWNKNSEKGGER